MFHHNYTYISAPERKQKYYRSVNVKIEFFLVSSRKSTKMLVQSSACSQDYEAEMRCISY